MAQSTKEAFLKAKVNIVKGCVSDIPVGLGTQRNEALHKSLNFLAQIITNC